MNSVKGRGTPFPANSELDYSSPSPYMNSLFQVSLFIPIHEMLSGMDSSQHPGALGSPNSKSSAKNREAARRRKQPRTEEEEEQKRAEAKAKARERKRKWRQNPENVKKRTRSKEISSSCQKKSRCS